MCETETKAIIGGANFIRLLRNSHIEFNDVTVFALPSVKEKSCIVKINVTWDVPKFTTIQIKML